MLELSASNENWIFSPEQAEGEGLSKRPIGTGPFIFESGEPGRGHKWKRNPNYWKKDPWTNQQLPYLDGIDARALADPEAIRAAFVSGQIDTGPTLQRPEDMAQLAEAKPDTVFHIWQPWSAYQPHIAMRLDQQPWSDPRVRQALSLAIDRDAIIKSVFGGLAEYGYGLSYAWFEREFSWNKDELQPWIRYDPAEAKKLMAAAGYENGIGRTVELLSSFASGGYFDTYTLVVDSWKRNLGLDVQQNITPDNPTFFKSFYGKTYKDLAGTGFGIGFTDVEPDAFVYTASHSQSRANYYFVNDTELDALAVKQRQTLDRTERQKLILSWKERDLGLVTRLFTVGQYFPAARSPKYFGRVSNTVGANPFGWGSHITRNHWKSS
jgi:peptide/nickel transport system substrate-binding protein